MSVADREITASLTIDQFTWQAAGYAQSALVRNEDVLRRIVGLAEAGPADTVLDVACGPGLLVCAFAPRVRHATGIDLTPAMLEQAAQLQAEKKLSNVSWREGDVRELPYEDGRFSIVTSRYAFHHFPEPLRILKEMVRVLEPGGRLLVVDSSPAAAKAEAFNRMERLRDPSHVRAFTQEEFLALFHEANIEPSRIESFRAPGDLDSLLARSFPLAGDEARIRSLFEGALVDDALDVMPRREGSNIAYGFPVAILKAQKAASIPERARR